MFSPKSQPSLSSLWSYVLLHGKSRRLALLRVHLLETRKVSNSALCQTQVCDGVTQATEASLMAMDKEVIPGLNKA